MTVATDLAAVSAGLPDGWWRATEASGNLANSGGQSDFGSAVVNNAGGTYTYRADTNADGNPAGIKCALPVSSVSDEFDIAVSNPATHFTGPGTFVVRVKYDGLGSTSGSSYIMCVDDNANDDDVHSIGIIGTATDQPFLRGLWQDGPSSADQEDVRQTYSELTTDLMDGEWHTIGYTLASTSTGTDWILTIDGVEESTTYVQALSNGVPHEWWPDDAGWVGTDRVKLISGQPNAAGTTYPEDWICAEFCLWADTRLTVAQHLEVHQALAGNTSPFASKTRRNANRYLVYNFT